MIESKLIDNHYGAGNYLLINCSDGVKVFLDRKGYLTSKISCAAISDIDWSVLYFEDLPFDFVLVDNVSGLESDDLSGLLENILLRSESRVKIVLSLNPEAANSSRDEILKRLSEYGFQEDYTLSRYCQNSESETSKLNISAVFGDDKTSGFNREISVRERTFCEIVKNYIRQNERVAFIGLNELIVDMILNQQTTAAACSLFLDASSFIEGGSGNLISPLSSGEATATLQYDSIVIYSDHHDHDGLLYAKILETLVPGGRLICMRPSLMANDLDLEYFDIEAIYGGEKKFTSWKEIAITSLSPDGFFASQHDLFFICAMKSPFIDRDKFKYIETSYNYSSPPQNLLAFERDYINPWIVKSMVEFPFRNRLPSTLKKYAEYILDEFGSLSADYGAALAILGYQCAESPANEYEYSLMDKIVKYCNGISMAANPNPHQVRWLISLSVLAGDLNKKNGDFCSALKMYTRVANIDFKRFSPTIGTKILQAYYNATIMLFSKREYVKSEEYLKEGLLKGYELLSASGEEIYGDIEKPLQFTLYIYHDILDWMIKLTNAKNYLTRKKTLLPSLNTMTWSSVISERLDAINEMDLMIKHRDQVIKNQTSIIDERSEINNKMNVIIKEMDEEIKSQALIIDGRSEANNKMNLMICEKDEVIKNQASIIDEHLDSIGKVNLELIEKSEVIKCQAEVIDARWKAMASMEKIIEERDDYIRSLEKKINNHD